MFGGFFNSDLSSGASPRARGQAARFSRTNREPGLPDQVDDPPGRRQEMPDGTFDIPTHSAAASNAVSSFNTQLAEWWYHHDDDDDDIERDGDGGGLERNAPEPSEAAQSSFSFSKWMKDVTSQGSVIASTQATEGGASEISWTLSGLIRWMTGRHPDGVAAEMEPHHVPVDLSPEQALEDDALNSDVKRSEDMTSYDTTGADSEAALRDMISYRRDPHEKAASGDLFKNPTISRFEEVRSRMEGRNLGRGKLRPVTRPSNGRKGDYQPWLSERAGEWEQVLDPAMSNKKALLDDFEVSNAGAGTYLGYQEPSDDSSSIELPWTGETAKIKGAVLSLGSLTGTGSWADD